MELVYRLDGIQEAAERFWKQVEGRRTLAFNGEMGAGKTTFINALCVGLKVSGTVSSPTFSIINEYDSPEGSVYHIDLYRCRDEEEAIRAGVEECLYSGNISLVEWPSKAPGIFPDGTVYVLIEALDEQTRRITAETGAGLPEVNGGILSKG